MKLWIKILIALVFGVLTGLILGPSAEIFKPIGTIFLNLINMIIVLLVLASMTVGISRINDPKKLSRLGVKTLFLYVVTTVISIAFGLALAEFFEPGSGMFLHTDSIITIPERPDISQILVSLIPTNPIASLVSGNVIQIIVFSIFFGVAISFAGEKGRPVLEWMEALAEIMYKLTGIVMEFSPFGVFAIMASVSGTFGVAVLMPLMKLTLIYYVGSIVYIAIIFTGILIFIGRLAPIPFFKGMSDAIMVAFSTGSSSATLPVSMHCCQENLGVSKSVSSFILPLGATINMNGTAMR